MALSLPRLPRGPAGPVALARQVTDLDGDPVAPLDVRTCLRHRSYWLASCDACRAARRLTLNAGDCSALNSRTRL
jgi:hypothetical protein